MLGLKNMQIRVLQLLISIYILRLPNHTQAYSGRHRRGVPQVDVACTIFTIAKSCTSLLDDCAALCDTVDGLCNKLSKTSKVASIVCGNDTSMTSALAFFKDPNTAEANGITDVELFWTEVKENPLKVVETIVTKLIANGALKLSSEQFLGGFNSSIGGAARSISSNALSNSINNAGINTGGKILDGSLTGDDLVNSGSAIGNSVGQGIDDVVSGVKDTTNEIGNSIKDGFSELGDINADKIVDKAKMFGNKVADSVNSLLDGTKDTFNGFLNVFGTSNSASQCFNDKLMSIFCCSIWVLVAVPSFAM